MDVSFANPSGFWALLGAPAIVAIHFLHRESRRCESSTLFLLDALAPVSAEGRRVDRLRNSLPLWLQLAAISLLAWILADPRWLRENSFQNVTVVLDSTVSMEVFRPELREALQKRLGDLSHAAKHTEWTLMESDTSRETLYTGGDLPALLGAFEHWSPRLGTHDPSPALAVAQSLQRKNGIVIFATDHRFPVPGGVDLLAVGEPVDNCGFAGLRADADGWSALVVNSSDRPQSRTWSVETPGGSTTPVRIDLAPGEMRTLHGGFPSDRATLVLSGDRFALDDRMPLVRPAPKMLHLAVPPGVPFFERLAKSVPDADIVAKGEDVSLRSYDPLAPTPIGPHSIAEVRDPASASGYVPGRILAEEHPFTRDLNWQGLLCLDTLTIPPQPGDVVLVWQGERPLIFLRGSSDAQALVFNFDVTQSNADRIPAVIVLMHRFLESVRQTKVERETANVETNQLLNVASVVGQAAPEIKGDSSPGGVLRAPGHPQFFQVAQGGRILLDGAAHFADTRAADFREASSYDGLRGDRATALVRQNSRSDFLTPWLLVVLLGICLANWATGDLMAPGRKNSRVIFELR